jgi:uncharacterized protein (TIGR02246 family)
MTFALLAAAVLFGSAAAPAQQIRCASADDARAIGAIADQWKESYNSGDAARVASLYAPDAYYLTQHFAKGVVSGRALIQAYVQLGVDARYRVDSIRILAGACSGDLAYTVGTYESDNGGRRDFGVNIVVLKKVEGKWLIVAHESAVPDAATAIRRLDPPAEGHAR